MDLETENRIAVILMKEAAELRKQAEKEGVGAYLQRRQPRGRPNSRFLTATVLGVQQANKAVEVNGMWRVRQRDRELDERLKRRSRDLGSNNNSHRDATSFDGNRNKRHSTSDKSASASCSPSIKASDDCHSEDTGGLRDEEIEEFLHSRVKRGRGAVGSRMDEAGPYFPLDSKELLSASHGVRHSREFEHLVLGPQKPSSLNRYESASEEESDQERRKKAKKVHSRKHISSKDKDKKKKRSKHRK